MRIGLEMRAVIAAMLILICSGGERTAQEFAVEATSAPLNSGMISAASEPELDLLGTGVSRSAVQSPLSRLRPGWEIGTQDSLRRRSRAVFDLGEVRVTYYVLDRSARCHPDSLDPCLQQHLRSRKIAPEEFRFTYFLDRVLDSGSGILTWEGQDYFVRYDALRKKGWASGRRQIKNNYKCASFGYRNKNSLTFIRENLADHQIFTPLALAPHPNGSTASGQPAVDWQTLAVNLQDLPLSVPDPERRASLARRFTVSGRRPPQPRVLVVLTFPGGRQFLTEASDTGSGVRSGTVDWRIGNTAAEIAYFHQLGSRARATGYVIADENVSFNQMFELSHPRR